MSSIDKFPQLLFILKTLHLSLMSEGQLFWVKYSYLGVLFSFSTLNISCYYLIACNVSAEKLALSGICYKDCFSLAAFKIIFLSLILGSFIIICIEDLFRLNLFGGLWVSWIWMSNLFLDLWSFHPLVI